MANARGVSGLGSRGLGSRGLDSSGLGVKGLGSKGGSGVFDGTGSWALGTCGRGDTGGGRGSGDVGGGVGWERSICLSSSIRWLGSLLADASSTEPGFGRSGISCGLRLGGGAIGGGGVWEGVTNSDGGALGTLNCDP